MKKPPFIIAEIGINHNGDIEIAKETIKLAHKSGASAVKLQTFQPDSLCSFNSKYYDLFKKCFLDEDKILHLIDYARKIGANLFSSVLEK